MKCTFADRPLQRGSLYQQTLKNVLTIIIFVLAALIHLQNDVSAQQRCSQIEYPTPDASLQEYRLNQIEGQTIYASPSQKWELGSGNGVCVTIFDRKTKERVASVRTDNKGQFEFVNIAPGKYMLTADAGDLQVISIPLQLRPGRRDYKSHRLLLRLREKQDKRKSYVTLVTLPALRKELLEMIERDQNIRDEIIKSGADHPSKEVLARMDLIDRRNTLRMKSIIKENGWPGLELVGWDGSEAAFFLIQHADHVTQKELLPLMQKAYRTGELSGPNYALFIDRVLVGDERPQIYGTQPRPFDRWEAGEPVFYPIEDQANVDKRRAEVGLSSLSEYRETLKRMYHPRNK
jgi:hypothetical protein